MRDYDNPVPDGTGWLGLILLAIFIVGVIAIILSTRVI